MYAYKKYADIIGFFPSLLHHAPCPQFHTVSIYELSVAVAIGKMFFNEVKEPFADVSSNIFTPWGVVP